MKSSSWPPQRVAERRFDDFGGARLHLLRVSNGLRVGLLRGVLKTRQRIEHVLLLDGRRGRAVEQHAQFERERAAAWSPLRGAAPFLRRHAADSHLTPRSSRQDI